MRRCIIVIVISLFIAVPVFAQEDYTIDHSDCVSTKLQGGDIFPVGTVQISILEQEDFQGMMGPEWVLMDGRSVNEKAELAQLIPHFRNERGEITIPDARGRFLRMANNGADVDPAKNRFLGSPQDDALQNITGNVEYISRVWYHKGQSDGAFIKSDTESKTLETVNTTNPNPSAAGALRFDAAEAVAPNGSKVKTDPYETRPTNIAVNYFVKICECRTEKCK